MLTHPKFFHIKKLGNAASTNYKPIIEYSHIVFSRKEIIILKPQSQIFIALLPSQWI